MSAAMPAAREGSIRMPIILLGSSPHPIFDSNVTSLWSVVSTTGLGFTGIDTYGATLSMSA
jgi:hypothetical protein